VNFNPDWDRLVIDLTVPGEKTKSLWSSRTSQLVRKIENQNQSIADIQWDCLVSRRAWRYDWYITSRTDRFYLYVYVCMHIYMYLYIYIYIHIFAYIHIYTYMYKYLSLSRRSIYHPRCLRTVHICGYSSTYVCVYIEILYMCVWVVYSICACRYIQSQPN